MSGIRTVDDLKDRCRLDEDTGCWLWAGGLANNLYPSFWYPPLAKPVTAGVGICHLLTGRLPHKGEVWHKRKGCDCHCVNPYHRKQGNRSTQMKAAGIKRSVLTKVKISRNRARIPDEVVADVMQSGETLEAVSSRLGLSMSHASNIRRGKQRKPLLLLLAA